MWSRSLARATMVCGSLLWVACSDHLTDHRDGQPTAIGRNVWQIEGIDFTLADATVLVVVSPSCPYCVAGMPPLGAAIRRVTERQPGTQTVVAGVEPEATLKAFADEYDLPASKVLATGERPLPVHVTPALVLFDRNGRVRGAWEGEPSSVTIAEFSRAVERVVKESR